MRHTRGKAGLTLAEAMVATALLAIASAGLTQAVVAGQMQALHARHTLYATLMAEELMERILAARFEELAAYDGYQEPAGAATTASANLDVPPDADVFARSVSVTVATVDVPALGSPIEGRRIQITLTDAQGRQWTLARFVPEP